MNERFYNTAAQRASTGRAASSPARACLRTGSPNAARRPRRRRRPRGSPIIRWCAARRPARARRPRTEPRRHRRHRREIAAAPPPRSWRSAAARPSTPARRSPRNCATARSTSATGPRRDPAALRRRADDRRFGSETSRFFIAADPATGVKIPPARGPSFPDLTPLDPLAAARLGAAAPAARGLRRGDASAGDALSCAASAARSPIVARAGFPAAHPSPPCRSSPCARSSDEARRCWRSWQPRPWWASRISNVRTGLVHLLGESLAAQTPPPPSAHLARLPAPRPLGA